MFQKAIPLLPSLHLRATIDFYETRIGFTGTNRGNYAMLVSGNTEIHFYLVTDPLKFQPGSCVICTHNLEDLYTSFAGKDIIFLPGQIKEAKAGRREFSIRDNNGNLLKFVQYDQAT